MTFDSADPNPFRPLGPERRHYWLAKRMAKATGVDLEKAMDHKALTQEDWAGMVTLCRGCDWVQGCKHWLAKADDSPRDLPQGCANRDRFADLRVPSMELDQ